MSQGMRRCASCGSETEWDVCGKCYMKKHSIIQLDDIIKLKTCPKCGFYQIQGRWRNICFDEALNSELERSLHVHEDFMVEEIELAPLGGSSYSITLYGTFRDAPTEINKSFEVRIAKETCYKCSRISGGYYESILQLRADGRDLEELEVQEAKRIVEAVLQKEVENPKAFVSKIVEKRASLDIYFGDRNLGRKISRMVAKELGGSISESKKIAGRKDGVDFYRFTYSVRLPCYRVGDVVEAEGRILLVTNKKARKGVDVRTGESVTIGNARLLARKEDIRESVVISGDEFAIDILHPESGKVITTRKPAANLKPGDEVLVAISRDEVIVIPKGLI
jgi:nonsense-mediated mRNA decay protein 3